MNCAIRMSIMLIISLVLFFLSLVIPLCHDILLSLERTDRKSIPDLFLRYSLFFNVGCLFLFGFIAQIFYAHDIADCLGWSWSPFQYELAVSELSFAVLGLLSLLFGYQFWLATALGAALWLLGASAVHIASDIFYQTSAVYQSNGIVYWNVVVALWLLVLAWISYKRRTGKSIVRALLEGGEL